MVFVATCKYDIYDRFLLAFSIVCWTSRKTISKALKIPATDNVTTLPPDCPGWLAPFHDLFSIPSSQWRRSLSMSDGSTLSVVALSVALVALFIALGQLLGQYFATADGYRRCQSSVMGPWAKYTRLSWRWRQFRFETYFTTPQIIFLPDGHDSGRPRDSKTSTQDALIISDSKEVSQSIRDLYVLNEDGKKDEELVCWISLLQSLYVNRWKLDQCGCYTRFVAPKRTWCFLHVVPMQSNKIALLGNLEPGSLFLTYHGRWSPAAICHACSAWNQGDIIRESVFPISKKEKKLTTWVHAGKASTVCLVATTLCCSIQTPGTILGLHAPWNSPSGGHHQHIRYRHHCPKTWYEMDWFSTGREHDESRRQRACAQLDCCPIGWNHTTIHASRGFLFVNGRIVHPYQWSRHDGVWNITTFKFDW